MTFIFKAVAQGLGAVFGLGGVLLLVIGTTTNNSSSVSTGWALVALAVVMWFVSLVARRL